MNHTEAIVEDTWWDEHSVAIQILIDSLPFYVILVNEKHVIVMANAAVANGLGKQVNQIVGCYCPKAIHGMDHPFPGCPMEEAVKQGHGVEKEIHDLATGKWLRSAMYPLPAHTPSGHRIYFHAVWDISDKKDAEKQRDEYRAQFLQSQKMEALGRLASGIAHDFKNILTAINGNVELLLDKAEPENPLRHGIEQVGKAGAQAIIYTRRLLDLSRKGDFHPETLDVNAYIADMQKLLAGIAGIKSPITTNLKSDLPSIQADAGQIGQVLLNLVINAADAMLTGGKISISTDMYMAKESDIIKHLGSPPGEYLVVVVTDTGTGIPPEVIDRIFEPFFTTKESTKGTGLGLSTVFSITKQHGGWVSVSSEMGKGTTFSIFLPVHQPAGAPEYQI